MKPATFEYHRTSTVSETVDLLGRLGEDAKLLAGGQSLVPMMNFRLARPTDLVDINEVSELDHVEEGSDGLRIGSMTRHTTLEDQAKFSGPWRVLPDVARWIGHYPIRTRGTFGGSVAHADPSAELPVLLLALDAELDVQGPNGSRTASAETFFKGPFQVDVAPDEILRSTFLPRPPEGTRFAIREFAKRAGDFAVVLAIVGLQMEDGVCRWARIGLGGVGGVPRRAPEAEQLLVGQGASDDLFDEAGRAAAASVEPPEDIHASAEYRKHLVRVLVRRALAEASATEKASSPR